MKIYLVSDLHMEFHKDLPLPESAVDVVVLAGDICVGDRTLEIAEKYQRHTKAPTILVAGNHEFHGTKHHRQILSFRAGAAKLEGVYFLETESAVIDDVRFLGCTLWTNFLLNGDRPAIVAKSHAKQFVPDFKHIAAHQSRFTTAHAVSAFESAYAWLDHQLAQPFTGKTVVVTHFLPHHAAVHDLYLQRGFDYLTPYYASNCSVLMQSHYIAAWLFGHTHRHIDTVVENGTRLVANPRGYPHEPVTLTRFDAQKIIEI